MYNKATGVIAGGSLTGSVGLAHTGFDGTGYAVAAVTLMLAGAALMRLTRTRKRNAKS